MKKKIIIDFLDKHWDEFTVLLSESAEQPVSGMLAEHFPDDLYEFADLLLKMISAYRYRTDTKGLLKKAQQFRKKASLNADEGHSPIIVKNGLFIVQPQQHSETLDTSFKNLVDSVL